MEFYYKKQIEELRVKCPPDTYSVINIESYRWTFDLIDDERNFKAQADKNPQVLNDKSDLEICDYYALSFHTSSESSKEHFRHISKGFPMAYKRLGTKIAKGVLNNEDGLAGEVEPNGHFNFHPIKDHQFERKFIIIENLP